MDPFERPFIFRETVPKMLKDSEEEMKIYFLCEENGPQWFICYGFLSNGFCFGQHICSHPSFAPGDLYFTRKNRINALREIFSIDPDTIETETLLIKSKSDVPDFVQNPEKEFKEERKKYEELIQE